MNLYYASTTLHEIGIELSGDGRVILGANAWIEDEFERWRAGRSVSRAEARFATGNEADCIKYLKAQQNYAGRPIYLYRVEMPSPQAHPMVLVDTTRRNQGNAPRLRDIVNEYWHPTQAWRFWEYLDKSLIIMEQLALPDAIMLAGAANRYNADFALAARLWPEEPTANVRGPGFD